jgi:hypothetical protein
MANPADPFADGGYVSGTQTGTAPEVFRKAPADILIEPLINVEQQKYGTGKPKRVITRGRIVHDR